jgi:hypothetical protein
MLKRSSAVFFGSRFTGVNHLSSFQVILHRGFPFLQSPNAHQVKVVENIYSSFVSVWQRICGNFCNFTTLTSASSFHPGLYRLRPAFIIDPSRTAYEIH